MQIKQKNFLNDDLRFVLNINAEDRWEKDALGHYNQSSALEFAKRLHHVAQASTLETPIEEKGVAGYTISMGIATFPNDGNTLTTLLLAADHAALKAKRLGKNQIYLASDL